MGIDQVAGARLATQHLLELGHREIVHLGGPVDCTEARARRDGWRSEMVRPGCGRSSRSWATGVPPAATRGRPRLATDPEVTAVFAANDQIAIGLLRALHEAGRRVPEDVSVVGFDDLPETGYLIPPLTTVRQDFPALGRLAIELLLVALGGSTTPAPDLIPPELIIRASTGPPPPLSRWIRRSAYAAQTMIKTNSAR